jgi:hypothetical protein
LKKHKSSFNKGCTKLLDEREQARLQWLQDKREINGDNLNNVRQKASRHSRNKEREYLKDKINQLFIDFKKANDSVRREVLYSTLIAFGVPMKLVRLIL